MTYEEFLDELATLLTEMYELSVEAAIKLVVDAQANDYFITHDDKEELRSFAQAKTGPADELVEHFKPPDSQGLFANCLAVSKRSGGLQIRWSQMPIPHGLPRFIKKARQLRFAGFFVAHRRALGFGLTRRERRRARDVLPDAQELYAAAAAAFGLRGARGFFGFSAGAAAVAATSRPLTASIRALA
jgi:hypothetical protein